MYLLYPKTFFLLMTLGYVNLKAVKALPVNHEHQLLSSRSQNIYVSSQGPVVQSIVSLTSSLRGQLVKCFMTL